MNRLALFENALSAVRAIATEYYGSPKVLKSVTDQIEYLMAVEQKKRTDTELLHRINVGYIAVREIEERGHIEAAELLFQVSEVAKRMQYEHTLSTAQQAGAGEANASRRRP